MEETRRKSWFGRNWGWVLGGGCLTIIILVIFGVGAAIFGISKAIGESEPYTHAYEMAIQNEAVIEALGEPIETGFSGSNTNYSYKNGETSVEMTIPINGASNSALIHVEGTKENDVWTYNKLYVDVENDDVDINLLEEDLENVEDGDILEE